MQVPGEERFSAALAVTRAETPATIKPSVNGVEQAALLPSNWLQAARVYGDALAAGAVPGAVATPVANDSREQSKPSVRPIVSHDPSAAELEASLAKAYRELGGGDMIVVNLPGRVQQGEFARGISREELSRALFAAGFDCPLITAGHNVLIGECTRSWPLDVIFTDQARGAAPTRFPGIAAKLEPPANRVVALARRSPLAPPGDRNLLLSVIMPVYNERDSFREVMDRLLEKTIPNFDIEVCLIESNSTDGTRDDVLDYAKHPRVRLILESKPSGKGHAVRKGLGIARGDVVLIQDADLEYDLDDYEKLLDPIRKLQTSFVLGSRHPVGEKAWQIREFAGQRRISSMMNLGHLFFTWFFNTTFRQNLRDPFTMYKVFRRDCIHNLRFECNRFDFDHELVGKLIRNGFAPIEIDIRYRSRSFDDGKKVAFFRDPPSWISACLRHRFSNLHVWPES